MKSRHRRDGFTLVELLVVITIIGMLMALLLPAVNAAQEAARSNTCKNNMRQIAIGMRTFEAEKSRFPGYSNTVGTTTVPWPVQLLPNIDRPDIYDTWVEPNGAKSKPYIELYTCPSNPAEQKGAPDLGMVYNAGNNATNKETNAHGVGLNYAGDGKSCNLDAMDDGASTVMLVSENIQATTWPDTGNLKMNTVFVWHDNESADRKINGNYKATSINADRARPSSYHSGGVNAAFADGSTRFVRQDINYLVYQHLMTPNSKEAGLAGVLDEGDYK